MDIELTPECFVDLVVLGLYWEHRDPVSYITPKGNITVRDSWTTVDHILRVYFELGIFTQAQIVNVVQHKRNGYLHQRRLMRFTALSYGKVCVENRESFLRLLQGSGGLGRVVNLARLVRDLHIVITDRGRERAIALQEKYKTLNVSESQYLEVAKALNKVYKSMPEKKRVAALCNYRERVLRDAGPR